MDGMKRLALALGAFGVVAFGVFSSSPAHAYQPVEAEELFADPLNNAPNAFFDAIVEGCFPGEQVVFFNFGATPDASAVAICDPVTYVASVTFQAPAVEGEYEIGAFLAAEISDNPDVPDRPFRFLRAPYFVTNEIVIIGPPLGGGISGGAAIVSTSGSGDVWPSFLTSAGFYRTFLGLLALMAGSFFVWLWRRRREDEQQSRSYGGSAIPPPDPSTPSLA